VISPNTSNRSIAEVIDDAKVELKDFISTRVALFSREVKEKYDVIKVSAPMLVVALVVGWAAFLVLSFAVVAVIAGAFGGTAYDWFFAALIVGFIYLCIAGICGWFGYREIKDEGMGFTHTSRVLRQDQAWLQNEAKSAAHKEAWVRASDETRRIA